MQTFCNFHMNVSLNMVLMLTVFLESHYGFSVQKTGNDPPVHPKQARCFKYETKVNIYIKYKVPSGARIFPSSQWVHL